jgi:tetratricopeptide (TPR) repeat protein
MDNLDDPQQKLRSHLDWGIALGSQGRFQEAAAYLHQLVLWRPDCAEAHFYLGVALDQQGRLDEAMASYVRALEVEPGRRDALNNLGNIGNVRRQRGDLDGAIACYQHVLRFQPDYAELHNNLGVALLEQRRLEEAAAASQKAVRLKPDYGEGYYNLGNALNALERWPEAVAAYQQAVALDPTNYLAHNNLANVFANEGRVDDALESYREAIRLNPQYAEAHNNLGLALLQPGRLEEAMACYEEAIRVNPDHAEAHFNRAAAWLLRGDYERGWTEYEWRWRRVHNPPRQFTAPLWDGSSLTGRTILVHAEQGLGDTLQFIRYVPLVKQRGGTVLFACQAPLMHLAASCVGIDQLLANGAPLPAFDVHVPLLSVPGILGTTLANIPGQVPYLHADPQLVEHWKKRLGGAGDYKIGIVWQGSPTFAQDRHRSFSLAQFAPLGKLPGVRLISLQKGHGREQLANLEGQFSVRDLGDHLDRERAFLDTAAIMQSLDLVIAPSTAIAHLAGALGVKVWVALSAVADWRWLLERNDSPWYPTARLFRQQQPGQWEAVFEDMAQALQELVPPFAAPGSSVS